MDAVYERCAGLDIHKKLIVACVLISEPTGAPRKQIRSSGTMADDLLALRQLQPKTYLQSIRPGQHQSPGGPIEILNKLNDRDHR
jgi:hypothetical protein